MKKEKSKILNCILLLLNLAGPIASADPKTAPFKTALCTAFLASSNVEEGSSNQVIFAIRDFEFRLRNELKTVQARRRAWREYFVYEYRKGAIVEPNVDDVFLENQSKANAPYELTLGRSIGRIQGLESDIGKLRAGVYAFGRVAYGAENIQKLWDSVESSVQDLSQKLLPLTRDAIPYFNNQRTDRIFMSYFGTVFSLAFTGLAAGMTLNDPGHFNPFYLASGLWPMIFRKNISLALLYAKSLFSKRARTSEENSWYYRAADYHNVGGILRKSLAEQSDVFFHLGLGVPLTESVGRAVVRNSISPNLIPEIFKSLQGYRSGFDESENVGWGMTDIFFYRDEKNQPVLAITGRMSKLMVAPDKPKQKEEPDFEWNLIPAEAGIRVNRTSP